MPAPRRRGSLTPLATAVAPPELRSNWGVAYQGSPLRSDLVTFCRPESPRAIRFWNQDALPPVYSYNGNQSFENCRPRVIEAAAEAPR